MFKIDVLIDKIDIDFEIFRNSLDVFIAQK